MAVNDAVFTEQLELELQLDQFAADLQAMEALWNQSMDRMQGKSGQLFGNNDFTGLIASIQTLTSYMEQLNVNFSEAFSAGAEGAAQTAGAVQEVTQAEVDAAAAAAKLADAQKQVGEAAAATASKVKETQASLFESIGGGGTSGESFFPGQQRGLFDIPVNEISSEFEKATPAVVEFGEGLQQLQSINEKFAEQPGFFSLAGAGGFGDNFIAGLTGGSGTLGGMVATMGSLLGQLTQWYIVWEAIVGTIDLVKKGIEGIFDVFKSALEGGFKYLSDIQDSAVEIRAALQDTVLFSKDPAENMRQAAESADLLAQKIREVAIASELKPEQLQGAFLALLTSGGGTLVGPGPNSLNDSLQLSTLLTQGLQLSGFSLNPRQISREVQNFVSGQSSSTSPLLQALNLSPDQARQLVDNAKQYHDILQQVETRLSGIVSKMGDVETRHNALIQLIDLYKEHLEGAFASAIFQKVNDSLQSVYDWLVRNQGQIEAWANGLGILFGDLYDAVKNLISTNWGTITGAFQTISALVANTAASLAQIVNSLSAVLQIREAIHNNPASVGFDNMINRGMRALGFNAPPDEKLNPNLPTISDIVKNTQQKNDAINAQLANFLQNGGIATGSGGALGNVIGFLRNALNPKDATEQLSQLEGAFKSGLNNIKQEFQGLRDSAQEAMKLQTINATDGAEQVVEAYQREINAAKMLRDVLAQNAKDSGAPAAQVQKFIGSMDNAIQQLQGQAQKAQDQANQNAEYKSLQDHEKDLRESLKQEQNDLRDFSTIRQNLAKDGILTEQDAFDKIEARTQESFARRKQMLNDFLKDNNIAQGTPLFEQIQNQLKALDDEVTRNHITKTQQQFEIDQRKLEQDNKRLETAKQIAAEQAKNTVSQLRGGGASSFVTGPAEIEAAQANVDALMQAMENAQKELNAQPEIDKNTAAYQKLQDRVDKLALSVENAQAQLDIAEGKGTIVDLLTGKTHFTNGQDGIEKFEDTMDSLQKSFQFLRNAVDNVRQGFQQGGFFGGVGAIATQSSGVLSALSNSSDALSFLGPIGAVAGVAGGLFSWIGQMFTEHARHIADDVKKAFDAIVKRYEQGQASFSTTMADLQKERNDAISQLSGVKGGKGYLTQILDQIDQETAQLQAQAQQMQLQFQGQLDIMVRGVDKTAQQWLQTWQQYLQQAHDYVFKYGGSPAIAGEFLNYQLFNQTLDLQQQFNQGAEKAVQDALQLNDLYDQRAKLQDEINKLTLKNNDSLERREAGAVSTLKQYHDQKKALQDQLDQVNANITAQAAIVNDESHVYQLAYDTASLHREDAQLRVAAADYELQTYREIQAILKNLYPAGTNITGLATLSYPQLVATLPQLLGQLGYGMDFNNFGYTGTSIFGNIGLGAVPAFGASAPSPAVTIGTINVNAPNATDSSGIAASIHSSLQNELGYRSRSGRFSPY